MKFEKLFGMASGSVLDFTNNSFDDFVRSSVKKNIWDDKYAFRSGSKANRLRAFWDIEEDQIVGKLLEDILGYWSFENTSSDSTSKNLYNDCILIVNKLLNKATSKDTELTKESFINQKYEEIDIAKLKLDPFLQKVIELRLQEIKLCLEAKSPLACIFLCGSTLEGILLNIATRDPKNFSTANSCPKNPKTNKVYSLEDWKLANLIDVSAELKYINKDVQKFSHVLRDFRNYIHPYQQSIEKFDPDIETARLCYQVLNTAVVQISRINQKF